MAQNAHKAVFERQTPRRRALLTWRAVRRRRRRSLFYTVCVFPFLAQLPSSRPPCFSCRALCSKGMTEFKTLGILCSSLTCVRSFMSKWKYDMFEISSHKVDHFEKANFLIFVVEVPFFTSFCHILRNEHL